jgi:hypothetical protein
MTGDVALRRLRLALKEHYAIERQPHADCFEMLKKKVIHLLSFPFDCFVAYAQAQQNEFTCAHLIASITLFTFS